MGDHEPSKEEMKSQLHPVALVPVLLCVPGGTDQDVFQPVPRTTQSVPADAGKLIPGDSVAVLQIPDLGALEMEVKNIAEAFSLGTGAMVDLSLLLDGTGLTPDELDKSKSGVVSFSMGPAGPAPVFIVPTLDASISAHSALPSTVSGDYLGLGMTGPPTLGDATPALGAEMPAGDLALRVDLKTLLEPMVPMVEMYLDPDFLASIEPSLSGGDAEALAPVLSWAKELVNASRNLELGLSLDDGALRLDLVLQLEEDIDSILSPGSANPFDLARMIPMENPTVQAISHGIDWKGFMDWYATMFDQAVAQLPLEQRDAFKEVMQGSLGLYEGLGGIGYAMDFTDNGMRGAGVFVSADPEKFIADYLSYLEGVSGLTPFWTSEVGDPIEIDGMQFATFTMRFDIAAMRPSDQPPDPQSEQMQQMFDGFWGKDGMRTTIGASENLVVMTIGDDTESLTSGIVDAVRSGKRYSNGVLETVPQNLHKRPTALMTLELRTLIRHVFGLAADLNPTVPEIPAGGPIPIWFSIAVDGPRYELQAHADLAGIAEVVRAMTR